MPLDRHTTNQRNTLHAHLSQKWKFIKLWWFWTVNRTPASTDIHMWEAPLQTVHYIQIKIIINRFLLEVLMSFPFGTVLTDTCMIHISKQKCNLLQSSKHAENPELLLMFPCSVNNPALYYRLLRCRCASLASGLHCFHTCTMWFAAFLLKSFMSWMGSIVLPVKSTIFVYIVLFSSSQY